METKDSDHKQLKKTHNLVRLARNILCLRFNVMLYVSNFITGNSFSAAVNFDPEL